MKTNRYLAHVYDTRDGVVYDYIGNRYVLATSFDIANRAIMDVLLAEHPVSYINDPGYNHYVELQIVKEI